MELTLIQKIAISALPLLFAITLHEVAHGFAAYLFGDQTAKLSGRLTLNPIKHIDLVGTILVPGFLLCFSNFVFGWAKPVPVDSRNIAKPRIEMPIIAFAGPLANFLMAFFWGAIAKVGYWLTATNPWLANPLIYMGEMGISINVVLGVLNCLPIPSLDGWHVLIYAISGRLSYTIVRLEQYGIFIFIILLVSGVISFVLAPPVYWLINWITALYGL